MIIRRGDPGDGLGYARVRMASWRQAYAQILPAEYLAAMDEADLANRWQESLQKNVAWVAEANGTVVGYIILGKLDEPDRACDTIVHALYIHPDFQGQGVGRELMATAVVHARREGVQQLLIASFTANERARTIYQAWGGVLVHEGMFPLAGGEYPDQDFLYCDLDLLIDRLTPLTIREVDFEQDDLVGLTTLLHRAYARSAKAGFHFVASHQDVGTTRERLEAGQGFVALFEGRAIATAILKIGGDAYSGVYTYGGTSAKLSQFAVDPVFRGRRIGDRLLEYLETIASAAGCREMVLDTAQGNDSLIRYYEQRHFKIVGQADYRPEVNYPSWIMAKRLV